MICLISPTYEQARKWADTQSLSQDEWFYASDKNEILIHRNFHTLVIGEFPDERLGWFEKIHTLAKRHGKAS